MQTLAVASVHQNLAARLAAVMPEDRARWGHMNIYQMLRHLAGANGVPLGETQVRDCSNLFRRTVMKWGGLWSPTPWPKGVPTLPELDQCRLGVVDGDFESARREVLDQTTRLHSSSIEGVRHPLFGSMTANQWHRWAWLHTDHHLRQFGR